MGVFDHLISDIRQILFPNAEQDAVPSMDGAFSPNDRLDACEQLGPPLPGADDIAVAADGTLYVSAGRDVIRLAGPAHGERSVVASFDGAAGGLAVHPDGRLLVCVAGRGLAAVHGGAGGAPQVQWLEAADGRPLHGLTGVTAGPDGRIFATVGSSRHPAERWLHDLMEKGRSGYLVGCDADLGAASILLDGLAFPGGVAVAPDKQSLWFTESWSHRVLKAPLAASSRLGPVDVVMRNLPGYPARLAPDGEGGLLLALVGVRTHLIEFVLREDDYRREMMANIPEAYWIGPALGGSHDCLEPMQIGSVKALGIQKPWAPPRSYGLLARIDTDGEVIESWHSRAGGHVHGVTAACETPAGVIVVSKGNGRLVIAREKSL
ncbi:SMP-30/gluconolactonase/LRE family protein [Chelatococcus reniformis]|uniref:NHL repeat containing protein n=1 Tax=Chelatococcus reniformis TaxID=1494448 RepID=A0A916TWS8_9HYPH|nr:SMP-30/gluconolactonase/LRE family protein [Chelatococcus reniformis]GGC48244.1 NHL repeat containing protein [Chelatococcus reniformis]